MKWLRNLFKKVTVTADEKQCVLWKTALKKFASDFMLSEEDAKEIDNSTAFKAHLYDFLMRCMIPSYADEIRACGSADAVDIWNCRYRLIINKWRELRLLRSGAIDLGLWELRSDLLDKLVNYDPETSIQAIERERTLAIWAAS